MSTSGEPPPAGAEVKQRVIGTVVTGALLFFVVYYVASIQDLRFQSRLFPTVVLLTCAVLLVAILIADLRKKGDRETSGPPDADKEDLFTVWRSILVPVFLIGGAMVIPLIGFYPAVTVLCIALLKLAGTRSWLMVGAVTVVAVAMIWLVFDLGIGITLPR